jgi:hypothetical protein
VVNGGVNDSRVFSDESLEAVHVSAHPSPQAILRQNRPCMRAFVRARDFRNTLPDSLSVLMISHRNGGF